MKNPQRRMREEKKKDEKEKKKAEATNTLKMLHWNLNLPREACLLKMTNNLTPSTGLTLPTNLLPLHPLKPFYFPHPRLPPRQSKPFNEFGNTTVDRRGRHCAECRVVILPIGNFLQVLPGTVQDRVAGWYKIPKKRGGGRGRYKNRAFPKSD